MVIGISAIARNLTKINKKECAVVQNCYQMELKLQKVSLLSQNYQINKIRANLKIDRFIFIVHVKKQRN